MAKRSNPVEPAGLASELVRELHKRDLIDDHGGRVIELMMRRAGMSYSEVLAVVAKAAKVGGRATGQGIADAYQKMYASPAKKAQLERLHDLRLEGMVDSKAYRPRAVTLEKLGRMIDMKLGKGRKANPAADAAAMYESFHGAPSTGELVIEDRVHYHGNLAELGVLCGLKVRVVTGYDVTLQFGGGLGAQAGNPAKYRVSVFSKGTGFHGEGSKVFTSRGTARRYFEDIAQEGYKVALVSDDSKIEHVSGMTVKEAKVYAVPGQRLNKGKASPGPLTKAYRFGTGIVPGLLEGADSALGTVVNPSQARYLLFSTTMQRKLGEHGPHTISGPTVRVPHGTKLEQIEKKGRRILVKGEFDGPFYGWLDDSDVATAAAYRSAHGADPEGMRSNPAVATDMKQYKAGMKNGKAYANKLNAAAGVTDPIGLARVQAKKGVRLRGTLDKKLSYEAGFLDGFKQTFEEGMLWGQRRVNPGSDTGPVILCSNESGNQLYFRGGDQALDLASIKMADFERDHMVIGEVWALAYATKKDFDNMTETEYVHVLGLEKFHQRMAKSADLWEDALPPKDEAFGCGNLPVLNYDTLNGALALAGGVYKIDKPMFSTSPGIEN